MTESEHIKKITPRIEDLVRDLEKMPAGYEAHVIAKRCVEKFWQSIQPAPVTNKPNEATSAADATSV
jgi:hypothetical protein